MPRFSVHHLLRDSKTVNEKKFLSTPKIQKNLNGTSMTEHKTDMNITKIEKYKKLNMAEHKPDMSITKIEKYKILNITENKTDMNITKVDKYKRN